MEQEEAARKLAEERERRAKEAAEAEAERRRKAAEDAGRLEQEEAARQLAEEQRRAKEAAEAEAEAERRRKAVEAARRLEQEEAARQLAEERERRAKEAEAERRRKAAEDARRLEQEEAARKLAEERERRAKEAVEADAERRRKAVEDARRLEQEEAARKLAEEMRRAQEAAEAEAERRRMAEEYARRLENEEAARKLAEENAERQRQDRWAAGAEANVDDEENSKGSYKPKVTWDERVRKRKFYVDPDGLEHSISETGRLGSPTEVGGGTNERASERRGWTEWAAGTRSDTRERGRGEIELENGSVRDGQDDGEISFEEPLPNAGPPERPPGTAPSARERPDVREHEERGGNQTSNNEKAQDDGSESDDEIFSIEALLRRLRETGTNVGERKILREYVRRAHDRRNTHDAVINGWDQPSDVRRTKRRMVGSDHVATGPGYDRGALLSTSDDMISAAEDYIRNQEGHVFVFGSDAALNALRTNPGAISVPSSGRQLPPWVWTHGNLLFIGKTLISNAVRERLESVTGQQYPKVSVLVSRAEERSLTPDERDDLHKLIAGAGRRGIMCAESICDGIPT